MCVLVNIYNAGLMSGIDISRVLFEFASNLCVNSTCSMAQYSSPANERLRSTF